MSIGSKCAVGALVAVLSALLMPGCVTCGESFALTDLRTETKTIELGGAESVEVRLDIGTGELIVGSGSGSLAKGVFTYNVAEWEPRITYEVTNGKGVLEITQPSAGGKSAPRKAENRWVLSLTEDVPIELSVDLGAGESNLKLGGLKLTHLDVDQGVGEVSVDLDGSGIVDMTGAIDGGVGSISVTVPTDVGVRVDGGTGIGSFKSEGLKKKGSSLVNDAYSESGKGIRLLIDAGVGQIRVETTEAGHVM